MIRGGTMKIAKYVMLVLVLIAGVATAGPKGGKKAAPAPVDPAVAAKVASAKPHVVKADAAFKLGKFAEALVDYEAAYKIYPAPAILFNIGQCQRNLKDFDKAIFSYESYLRASPRAKNAAIVEDLIRESKALLEKQKAEKADADARARAASDAEQKHREIEAKRKADEAAGAREQAETDRIAAARAASAESDRRSKDKFYRKWWFWGLVGTAAVAAGGTAYYLSGDTTYVDPMGSVGALDRR